MNKIYGYLDDAVIAKNVALQRSFFEKNQPDFVKIMSDAFLLHPSVLHTPIHSVDDLRHIESLGPDHPWIEKQVLAVKAIVDGYRNQIAALYNVFSPAYYFRLKFDSVDKERDKFARLMEQDPQAFSLAFDKIAADINALVDKLFTQANIDGIYLCVQSVQSEAFSESDYRTYVEPTQIALLNRANGYRDSNVLHICGFEGRTNRLDHFRHYPAKAINWATYVEGITLDEGKPLFADRAVIGGFDNTVLGALYNGDREAIEQQALALVAKNGKRGLILGADCSVPSDIDFEHIKFAAQIANSR